MRIKAPLQDARVVGYFSLPSPTLAEANPPAYNEALASAPEGAGNCSHCGTGILHHVIIVDGEGHRRFVGNDCAKRVGIDPEALRQGVTSEVAAERRARREQKLREACEQGQKQLKEAEARRTARREKVGDLVDALRGFGGQFYTSLADQLENGPLSERQGEYVAKAMFPTGRRNKKNADQFDEIWDRCCEPLEGWPEDE